jgi:hypothetical protein
LYGQRGKEVLVKNKDDIWSYIQLLKKESDEKKKQGSKFTTLNNIYEQLPFFCCSNNILEEKYQEDIAMYVYINETNTPAFDGSYSNTPSRWIDIYFIIKNALNIREKKLMEKKHGSRR